MSQQMKMNFQRVAQILGAGGLARRPAALALALLVLIGARAFAAPALLIDLDSGAVLYEDHATQPWFPASLTKLMTVYVALKAVHDHRIALDAPLAVTARAAAMPPSKMGFRPGTLVTLDTALKILMVKSANDVSVTVAEGVSGSVEAFAAEMNAAAASLGLQQSHFVNPNGLPNPDHYSSARDLAMLARALYQAFPEEASLFNIGALEIDGKIIANHNNLLGRYPGADGMKTGFTCAAGFNVVASATQGGRRLLVVILGAPTVALRTIKAAALFDRGFVGVDRPSGALTALPLQGGAPPDRGAAICRNRGPTIAEFNAENERLIAPLEAATSQAFASRQGGAFYDSSALSRISPMATRISLVPPPTFEPLPIRIAGYAPPAVRARGGDRGAPDAVSAYAAEGAASGAGAPVGPDEEALPMKQRSKAAVRAKAEPPRKVMHEARHGAGKAHAHASAHHRRHGGATATADANDDAGVAPKGSATAKAGHGPKGKHGKAKSAEDSGAKPQSGKNKADAHLKHEPAKASAKPRVGSAAKSGEASAGKAVSSAAR